MMMKHLDMIVTKPKESFKIGWKSFCILLDILNFFSFLVTTILLLNVFSSITLLVAAFITFNILQQTKDCSKTQFGSLGRFLSRELSYDEFEKISYDEFTKNFLIKLSTSLSLYGLF